MYSYVMLAKACSFYQFLLNYGKVKIRFLTELVNAALIFEYYIDFLAFLTDHCGKIPISAATP